MSIYLINDKNDDAGAVASTVGYTSYFHENNKLLQLLVWSFEQLDKVIGYTVWIIYDKTNHVI